MHDGCVQYRTGQFFYLSELHNDDEVVDVGAGAAATRRMPARVRIFSYAREKERADWVRDGLNSKNHGRQSTTNRNYLPCGGAWCEYHCL